MRRRQQFDRERHLPIRNCRMAVETEQFLHPNCDLGPALARIIDRRTRSGRRFEIDRRLSIEAPPQRPWQKFAQRGGEVVGGESGQRGLAGERRGEPLLGARCERRIGKVGPVGALARAKKDDAVAPLLERAGPWQPINAEIDDAFGEKSCAGLVGEDRDGPLAEHDGAEPAAVAAAQRKPRSVESNLCARSDASGKMRLDFGKCNRRGRKDAALRSAAGEFGHRQEWLAGERQGGIEIGAAAVRQQKRVGAGAAVFGNALRKSEGDQGADAYVSSPAYGGGDRPHLRPTRRHSARFARARRAIAAERSKSLTHIDIVAAETALADQRGQFGREGALVRALRVDHHARQARRQRQAAQLPAFVGDTSGRVDSAERNKKRVGFGERRARRRVEEGELVGLGAPSGEIERERGEVGGEDFRTSEWFERGGLRLVP